MLVQIAPELPPAISGVGHYAALVAHSLRDGHGIDSTFYPAKGPGGEERLKHFLDSQADVVLLQYSGYGYAAKGCPFWLVRALERWKKAKPGRRLVTVFHELAASGKPWESSFWLRPLQSSLVRRVARLSDAILTSRDANRRELAALGIPDAPRVDVLPIFSNVGEPRAFVPHREREDILTVFGTSGRREEVYRHGAALIAELCGRLGITKILDIGPECAAVPPALGGAAVESRGEISAEEIHSLLSRTKIGVVDYPANILAKSGIFAAYAAHGAAPVVLAREPLAGEDGLRRGAQYFLNGGPTSAAEAEVIGEAAFNWYREHGTAAHASWIAAAVGKHSNG